jgi:transketolase
MKVKEKIDQLCVNTIRTLSVDAIQKAKSGHPGMPMGFATAAYVLWTRYLKHNPQNPYWVNRDRFILSAGHASMLLYSLLYLTGYDVSLEDIKQFRQYGSITPGHPEYNITPGVETTTGPLGQGFTNGVGMAIAQKHLAARYNKPDFDIFDYSIYAIISDGDLMEGITSEAASMAGHLKLGNLIYLYDSNQITIEGSTDLTFTENVNKRFEAYGWQTISIDDGNDIQKISQAIEEARSEKERPTLINIKTQIAYGSPNKQGKASSHGSPLGEEEIRLTKENLHWEKIDEPFYVPEEALKHFRKSVENGQKYNRQWENLFEEYVKTFKEEAKEIQLFSCPEFTINWADALPDFVGVKALSTRVASGAILNSMAEDIPVLIGGSADLAPSTNSYLNGYKDIEPDSYDGRNIHFGIREHAMASICNGIALSNILIPYCSTFMVFADYMRAPMRLSALMKQQVIYILTHDSIGVGEDGPTHQPVEHLASLRAIPNLVVIRPADAHETREAWKIAIESRENPTALILSRQNLPVIDQIQYKPAEGLRKGAYILAESQKQTPDLIILATGSEVAIALAVKEELIKESIDARVVSFPSWELFEMQSEEYKHQVLPPEVENRLVIEAGLSMGWDKYTGLKGKKICIDEFGLSGPAAELMKKYGFTVENVVEVAKENFKI